LVIVAFLLRARLNIHPVEADHAWPRPFFDQRKQMHAGMTEINVHQICRPAREQFHDYLELAPVIDRRFARHVFQPEAFQKILPGARQQFDVGERKLGFLHPFAREDKGVIAPQPGDLPVDVTHLRLEKSRAIAGDDRLRHAGPPFTRGGARRPCGS
jgi:hypothetical protein